MTNDPYMDAINAGAAALAKPYRDPDTIGAFVETFPTIAAARVIDAALPHLRATILAEAIPPGPCPEVTEFGQQGPYADGVNPEPRTLRAICDLRAGHAGQHEADDEHRGNFRWSSPVAPYTDQFPALATKCATAHPELVGVVCWKEPGHADAHDNGAYMWNDCGEDIKTDTRCGNMRQCAYGDLLVCERTSAHPGWHIAGTNAWDGNGEIVLT